MKVLIDTIFANNPSHCASTIKMRKIVEYVIDRRDDVYFYWLVPEYADEEQLNWFPQHTQIKYIRYGYSKDRMREFMRVTKEFEKLVSFQGDLWDWDYCLTNRTSMVAHIKALANKPSRITLNWSKRVFLIEAMPVMSFKFAVPLSTVKAQTTMTLNGYLNADKTAISTFWEKGVILQEARKYLSASSIKYIRDTMIESSAVHVDSTGLKTKKSITRMLKNDRPFSVGHIGRMTHLSSPESVFSIMEKQWIMHSGKQKELRFMISTQSKVTGRVNVPDFIKLHQLAREDFWDLVKEEMDVFIFLSKEEDYSMSLMEPLILGCPAIVAKTRWAIPTLGEDYPFFVTGTKEGYAMLRAFYDDYAGMYAKFVKWSKGTLQPLLKQRNEVYVPKVFYDDLDNWNHMFSEYQAKTDSAAKNEITQLLFEYAEGNDKELKIEDAIRALDKQGKLNHLADKLTDRFKENVRLTWGTDWNFFRIGLMMLGYEDTGIEVGHMRRGV
ncbi:MAG: hypothetical protein KAH32_07610 [Chlamydiia bacterium]|nr:hypothetical protein [Chlamydiia bacterium]